MRTPAILLAAALGAALPAAARAQSGGAYDLAWHSVPGGAQGAAAGGAYALAASTGQAIAGELLGGAYALAGGFWSGFANGSVGVGPEPDPLPRVFAARPAGPNPFQGSTAIAFDLPSGREVNVAVFGLDGRRVRDLLHGHRDAGRHLVHWDGRGSDGRAVTPGVYFARVEAGADRRTFRLVRLH